MAYPKIQFASLTVNLKPALIEKIQGLQGIVLDLHHAQFNEQCTHLVVENDHIRPTERLLACLAAGIWIVRMSWVEASYLLGHWVPEEPHECMGGHGIPRYHRLRAKAAMESAGRGCALPGLIANNTSSIDSIKHRGIFSGWTMYVHVKQSSDSRSFRRVLSAAGAEVVSSSDFPRSRDRLNLVLCDNESIAVLRPLLGPGTLIAHHNFLRDILLCRHDPAKIQPYLYTAHGRPNMQSAGSADQPLILD
ncbi:DNA topoisomerase 2-binding protein 1-like [Hyalella azteca]|uniref:DNA topoisomerase 2-binding protein 1-like n=1 Tax=Hyalella azteca TaxID=294128 RepID=A0A8B7P5A7_HYAAZ|nr:DNA topoisomerase 2-binding protein 1-like [Hyalella azteca]